MTKILNLDSIENADDKSVTLNGETHRFAPFTVEQFVSQVKEIEALEKAGDMTISGYTEYSVTTITRAFPTITRDVLLSLPMFKLRALAEFVRGVAEVEAIEANEGAPDSGKTVGTSS